MQDILMWNTMLKSIKKYYVFTNGVDIPKVRSSTWTRRYILIMGILITSFGVVFFFPLTIDGRYTCFFHRIFDHSHPVSNVVNGESGHIHSEDIDQTDNGKSTLTDRNNNRGTGKKISDTKHGSVLLDNYLHQYAFPWWASLGLLALCIYLLLKLKRNIAENESNLTVKQ